MSLRDLVISSARYVPDAVAVKGPDGCITYDALDKMSNSFARVLSHLGVCKGDRVGIWLEKSTYAIVAFQGILRLNAIYVPLDPLSPAVRVHAILHDCLVNAVITTQERANILRGKDDLPLHCFCIDKDWSDLLTMSKEPLYGSEPGDDEIAYILYTSGSTGKPKGVCISNRNALAFIEWAGAMLQVTPEERFSNHAPLHFDLSVLDLYVAFHAGAVVSLLADGASYNPKGLVNFIKQEAITIWYSVPSALILMMERGGLLMEELPSLRAILFAGEAFPIKHLRCLCGHMSQKLFFNLYGPTETNVCTYYEVKEIDWDSIKQIPIGRACSGDDVWARKDDQTVAIPGEEGELIVAGPTVMVGYWGQPAYGTSPYATGDIVQVQEDGNYIYVGRRDHMVKLRGYRVEPGDVEAALEEHSDIHEAAASIVGDGMEARLVAFIVCTDARELSLLEIKRHCAARLPRYMIVDEVRILKQLPRTRNGKLDRLALQAAAV